MPSRDSPGVTCATGSCSTCRISSPTRPGSPHPRLLLGSELLEVVGEQAVAVGQGGGVLPEPGQQEGGEPGGRREIGRASCRERVERAGGAGSLEREEGRVEQRAGTRREGVRSTP